MRNLTLLLFVSTLALARWDSVDQTGNPVDRGQCRRGSCYLKDSQTGTIWTHTYGQTNVLGIGGPSTHYSQNQAAQICAQFGYRLASANEYSAAISNGLAFANRNFPEFGNPQWFFWSSDAGIAMSLEAPLVNPTRGLQGAKFKCVNGAGGGGLVPPVAVNRPEVVQQIDQTANEVSQETNTFMQELDQNRIDPNTIELPNLIGTDNGNNTGTMTVVTPQKPLAQVAQQRQATYNPQHGGQGSGAAVEGQPARISNAWNLGTDYFGGGFTYTLAADPNLHAEARASVDGTVLRKRFNLVGLNLETRNRVRTLGLQGEARIFGNSVGQIDDGVNLGQAKTIPGKVLFNQRQQLLVYRFAIGPVPVSVKAGTQGELGYRPSTLFAHYNPAQQIKFGAQAVPYTSAGVWGSGAADIVIASAGVRVSLNLISGNMNAGATYVPEHGRPCFSIYLQKVTMLNGRFAVFVEWTEVTTEVVSRIVEGVCRWFGNSWFGREVCGRARRITETVRRYNSVKREQTLFNWNGRSIGAENGHRWYDSCVAR